MARTVRTTTPVLHPDEGRDPTVVRNGNTPGSMTGGLVLSGQGVDALPWTSLIVFATALFVAAVTRRAALAAPTPTERSPQEQGTQQQESAR
ncbi:hypothetical protein [Streptomyces mirabilis]|uniref:hypothetical protein n=1 Tax=Streptomyces mirabilis TaxID=68239 RepID=UPI0036DC85FD